MQTSVIGTNLPNRGITKVALIEGEPKSRIIGREAQSEAYLTPDPPHGLIMKQCKEKTILTKYARTAAGVVNSTNQRLRNAQTVRAAGAETRYSAPVNRYQKRIE